MYIYKSMKKYLVVALGVVIAGCSASGDNPGKEYAPNMYHSVAYEPLKQIKNKESGMWVSSLDNGVGEYYSSNPNNPHEMNMREPVANTVRRSKFGFIPNRIHKDSFALAERVLKSPLPNTPNVEKEGKVLYEKFCDHCHGAKGIEPGKVGEVFLGVPAYTSAAIKNKGEGHLFHVISHGKGRMGAHASQLSIEERWKIVRYVQKLQNQ